MVHVKTSYTESYTNSISFFLFFTYSSRRNLKFITLIPVYVYIQKISLPEHITQFVLKLTSGGCHTCCLPVA